MIQPRYDGDGDGDAGDASPPTSAASKASWVVAFSRPNPPLLLEFWHEAALQLHLAAPMILVNLSLVAFQFISTVFVGHLGELALASSSIAMAMVNVTGFCFMMGIASSLETLCGQAYGAKQYEMLGIYMQRGLFVLHITAIPFAFLFGYMGQILAGLGQNKTISCEAGKYARWLIPALFAQASAQVLIRFLQTQSLVYPLMASSILSVVCHIPLCWFLSYKTSLGFEGAAISTSISSCVGVFLLFMYVGFSPSCRRTRAPLTWRALHDMRSFLHLALPAAAMVCLEWWCYEFLVLLSGLLPDPELQTSTLATCLNLANLTFQIGAGLGACVSTRVSNELGAGRPQAARVAISVGMLLTISQACITSSLYLWLRGVLGHAFSSDIDVVKNVSMLIKLVSISSFLDSTQAVLSGIARGCGWQKMGALINLGSFYVVGLPVSCILSFLLDLRVQGLWVGVICAPLTQIVLLGAMTWTTNWDDEVIKAQKRMESSNLATALLLQ